MDVRTTTQAHPVDDGLLHMEMFWSGEVCGGVRLFFSSHSSRNVWESQLPADQEKFKSIVAAELDKYGAKWEPLGELREAGCMIAMVAYPFSISEEKALELGHAMFSDFGNPPEDKK